MCSILAYFSPETLLPATSIIATALGFFMLVGRASFRLIRRGWHIAKSRSLQIANTSEPHYHRAAELHRTDAYNYTAAQSVTGSD